jgi:hypothetical protein
MIALGVHSFLSLNILYTAPLKLCDANSSKLRPKFVEIGVLAVLLLLWLLSFTLRSCFVRKGGKNETQVPNWDLWLEN